MSDFYCDEVLSGVTPVEIVNETADVLAFRHTRPHWPVHVVVIPKRHIASLLELAPAGRVAAELLATVQRVARDVLSKHGSCHVVTNLGGYQESKHLHWHIGAGEPLAAAPP